MSGKTLRHVEHAPAVNTMDSAYSPTPNLAPEPEGAPETGAPNIIVKETPPLSAAQAANAAAALEVQVRQELKVLSAQLRTEPKVPMLIPADPLNPDMKIVPVTINGLRVEVPVGKLVNVPRSVAGVLADSDYIATKITRQEFNEAMMP